MVSPAPPLHPHSAPPPHPPPALPPPPSFLPDHSSRAAGCQRLHRSANSAQLEGLVKASWGAEVLSWVGKSPLKPGAYRTPQVNTVPSEPPLLSRRSHPLASLSVFCFPFPFTGEVEHCRAGSLPPPRGREHRWAELVQSRHSSCVFVCVFGLSIKLPLHLIQPSAGAFKGT